MGKIDEAKEFLPVGQTPGAGHRAVGEAAGAAGQAVAGRQGIGPGHSSKAVCVLEPGQPGEMVGDGAITIFLKAELRQPTLVSTPHHHQLVAGGLAGAPSHGRLGSCKIAAVKRMPKNAIEELPVVFICAHCCPVNFSQMFITI